jgi:hypothetical protein
MSPPTALAAVRTPSSVTSASARPGDGDGPKTVDAIAQLAEAAFAVR